MKTLWNTFWNISFEKHWNLWGILKTLWNTFWKHFETHHLKTIETYREFWKRFETHFENTLKHIICKPLKPIGNFENTLKHIIWKPLKHIICKPLKPIGNFENTLKHIIWKPLKPMRNFENTLKHIIWKPLKPIGNFENTLKHIDTPVSCIHSGVTIETLGFQLALKWNTYVQPCMKRKSAFSRCWKYRLHYFSVKQWILMYNRTPLVRTLNFKPKCQKNWSALTSGVYFLVLCKCEKLDESW